MHIFHAGSDNDMDQSGSTNHQFAQQAGCFSFSTSKQVARSDRDRSRFDSSDSAIEIRSASATTIDIQVTRADHLLQSLFLPSSWVPIPMQST